MKICAIHQEFSWHGLNFTFAWSFVVHGDSYREYKGSSPAAGCCASYWLDMLWMNGGDHVLENKKIITLRCTFSKQKDFCTLNVLCLAEN